MNEIVLLLGRGVEGCGVTKFTVELADFLEKRGESVRVIALKDKTWSRKDSHELKNLELYKFAKEDQFQTALKVCDEARVVIVNSLPSVPTKKGIKAHDQTAVENFIKLIETTKAPLVMIQHDHNKLSLRRNAGTAELVKRAKLVLAHSKTGHFAAQVDEIMGKSGLDAFLDETPSHITTFQPAVNFDQLRERYWQPIEAQDSMVCRWIGRTTFWKGFVPMFDFHNNYLRDAGYATILEGIEKSPAYLDFKTKSVFIPHLGDDPNDFSPDEFKGKDAAVFSVYNNDAMLKRMALGGFGYQLSLLDPIFIDKSVEYTHCEIAAVGVIPVFRKEFGDACTHRVTGNKLTSDSESGTIWLPTNKDEMGDAFKIVQMLTNDSGMRDEWRQMAFEYYRSHQDSSWVFSDMMRQIEEAI